MLSEAWLRRIRRFLGEVICKSGPKEEAQEGSAMLVVCCTLVQCSLVKSSIRTMRDCYKRFGEHCLELPRGGSNVGL